MKNKIIFLDLDGPIFDNGNYIEDAGYCLKELVKLTGAKIVITSDWRIGKSLDQVMSRLSVFIGLTSQEVIDLTKVIYYDSYEIARGAEIELWLRDHPEVDNYVIIDDSETAALVSMSSNFVKVGKAGFNGECFRDALRILG